MILPQVSQLGYVPDSSATPSFVAAGVDMIRVLDVSRIEQLRKAKVKVLLCVARTRQDVIRMASRRPDWIMGDDPVLLRTTLAQLRGSSTSSADAEN